MKRFGIILCLAAFSTLCFSQKSTFFEPSRLKHDAWKTFFEWGGQFSDGRYYVIAGMHETTFDFLKIGVYDNGGLLDFEKTLNLPIGNPEFSEASSGLENTFFLGGTIENGQGVFGFSGLFDDSGKLIWGFNDSLVISHLTTLNSSEYIALLSATKNTSNYTKGLFLVKVSSNGIITKSKKISDLIGDSLFFDEEYNQVKNILSSQEQLYLKIKIQNPIKEHFVLVKIDSNWQATNLKKINNWTDIVVDSNLVFLASNKGSEKFGKATIVKLDSQFNESEFYSQNDLKILANFNNQLHNNDNHLIFHKIESDSSLKKTNESLLFIDKKSSQLMRECTYKFEDSDYFMGILDITNDMGMFIYHIYMSDWAGEFNLMKTDSLGLVYNTDVICDCKDYNTGIGEQEAATENVHVTVFPNPASEKVVVQLRNPTQAKVELQSLNGQLIQSHEEYSQRFMFEVDDLPKGIYLLRIQSESGARVTRKLVVQ